MPLVETLAELEALGWEYDPTNSTPSDYYFIKYTPNGRGCFHLSVSVDGEAAVGSSYADTTPLTPVVWEALDVARKFQARVRG